MCGCFHYLVGDLAAMKHCRAGPFPLGRRQAMLPQEPSVDRVAACPEPAGGGGGRSRV